MALDSVHGQLEIYVEKNGLILGIKADLHMHMALLTSRYRVLHLAYYM